MAASRIVMQDFFEKYEAILIKAGLRITLLKVYVDDSRQITSLLKQGMRYDPKEEKFVWSKEAEEEDREMERRMPDGQRAGWMNGQTGRMDRWTDDDVNSASL